MNKSIDNKKEVLEKYLLSPYGTTIYFEEDMGKLFHFSLSTGTIPNPNQKVVAYINCPGVGNLDSDDFYYGWTGYEKKTDTYFAVKFEDIVKSIGGDPENISLDVAIRTCIESGDMASYIDNIIKSLKEYNYDSV